MSDNQPDLLAYSDKSDKVFKRLVNQYFLLGFDKFLENLMNENFPHYDVIRTDKGFLLEIALAGFTINDLTIEKTATSLIIQGKKPEDQEKVFLYKGIAKRSFKKVFLLADGMKIIEDDIFFKNGILTIQLEGPYVDRNVKRLNIKSDE